MPHCQGGTRLGEASTSNLKGVPTTKKTCQRKKNWSIHSFNFETLHCHVPGSSPLNLVSGTDINLMTTRDFKAQHKEVDVVWLQHNSDWTMEECAIPTFDCLSLAYSQRLCLIFSFHGYLVHVVWSHGIPKFKAILFFDHYLCFFWTHILSVFFIIICGSKLLHHSLFLESAITEELHGGFMSFTRYDIYHVFLWAGHENEGLVVCISLKTIL